MRISYDSEVDALSIFFRETSVTTKHLAEGIAADYDRDGHLAGIEILDAVRRFGDDKTLSTVWRLPPQSFVRIQRITVRKEDCHDSMLARLERSHPGDKSPWGSLARVAGVVVFPPPIPVQVRLP